MTVTNEKIKEALISADALWKYGSLAEARKHYADVLTEAPNCWHAAFQLAWIDSAFEALPKDRIERLRRSGLPPAELDLLNYYLDLMLQQTRRLPGRIEDWDIEALRTRGRGKDATWWEARAAEADDGDEPGVAYACYCEAEKLEPEMYYDPPSNMPIQPGRAERHIAFLQSVDKCSSEI